MLTTLVMTIVLGNADVAKFGYVYPDQFHCENAKSTMTYATTGKYSVELECQTEEKPSPTTYKPMVRWQALVMGMVKDTVVVTLQPSRRSVLPDSASCEAYIHEANQRFKQLGGRDYVSLCLPEAPQ